MRTMMTAAAAIPASWRTDMLANVSSTHIGSVGATRDYRASHALLERDRPVFHELGARDVNEALFGAAQLSRAWQDRHPSHLHSMSAPAFAVLQARNGTWWATSLAVGVGSVSDEPQHPLSARDRNGLREGASTVRSAHPDVQGIASSDVYFDLTADRSHFGWYAQPIGDLFL